MKKKPQKHLFPHVILSVWSLIIIGGLGMVLMSSFTHESRNLPDLFGQCSRKLHMKTIIAHGAPRKMSSYFMNSVVTVFASIFRPYGYPSADKFCIDTIGIQRAQSTVEPAYLQYECTLSAAFDPPLYDQLLNLGLVNTRAGLILIYIALYFPFSLFVLTGFFRTLP